jgi:hypothetical protein
MASAGLNWVRLPVPYWAIKKWEGEPFLEKVAWECASMPFHDLVRKPVDV